MNWDGLYNMQQQLDQYIEGQQGIEKRGKVEEKILALLVEVGELANETRCFKFWSNKAPSEKEVILEEYVDGIHFILSLGIDLGYRFEPQEVKEFSKQTKAFLDVYDRIGSFRTTKGQDGYQKLFVSYLGLGLTLGITGKDMIESYQLKNEVNFQRQDEGY